MEVSRNELGYVLAMLLRDMALHLLFEFNLRLYGWCAMTDVKRLDIEQYEGEFANMVESYDGDYVRYEDYAALEAELAKLRSEVGAQLVAALAAPVHPDDASVDAFAAAMKSKLTKSRAKGRGGWDDKAQCSQQHLSDLLRGHVDKGDPVDVANFCMMLSLRGEGIAAALAEMNK